MDPEIATMDVDSDPEALDDAPVTKATKVRRPPPIVRNDALVQEVLSCVYPFTATMLHLSLNER